MSNPSATFTEMVTTTLRSVGKDLADNVSEHNALMRWMKDNGKIETISGGYEIQEPLMYAENGTFERFSGYDQLNTSASDVLTSAKFDWKQSALHVTASGREIMQNSGKEAMKNLVKARKKVAMITGANNLSRDLYSTGALANQIGGLGNIIQTDGNGTVGGFNSATYSWWSNKYREMTGTNLAASPSAANAASLKADMNALWLSTTRGTDKPDLVMASNDMYALYELGEQQLQRYQSGKMAEAGFQSIRYKSAEVIHDENTNFASTAEKMYFINCDYLKLKQHRDAQWTPDAEKRPTNQDAVVIPIYWMGALCVSNRARQGVLFDDA